jgi:predicted kinase
MSPTPIIVVTGPPASGKSSIAAELARRLALPLIAKDAIKESLYESLGVGDRAWSRRLGVATYALIFHVLGRQLEAGRPCIVEGTFGAEIANARFADLCRRWPFDALQIFCTASDDILVSRYAERAPSRHRGHVDATIVEEVTAQLKDGRWAALDIAGRMIVVETSDFGTVDIDAVVRKALAHVSRE